MFCPVCLKQLWVDVLLLMLSMMCRVVDVRNDFNVFGLQKRVLYQSDMFFENAYP